MTPPDADARVEDAADAPGLGEDEPGREAVASGAETPPPFVDAAASPASANSREPGGTSPHRTVRRRRHIARGLRASVTATSIRRFTVILALLFFTEFAIVLLLNSDLRTLETPTLSKAILSAWNDAGLLILLSSPILWIILAAGLRAETARERSETRCRQIVEHIPEALVRTDVAGRIVFANRRFLELFGIERRQLPDVTVADCVAPEWRSRLRDRHRRRARGETVPSRSEYQCIRQDGARFWAEVDVVQIFDDTGERVGVQSLIRDITNRRRAADALRRSYDVLNLTGRMAQIGSWAFDVSTLAVTWTDQMYRMHGVDPDVHVTLAETIACYAPDARAIIEAAVQAAIDSGTSWDLELPLTTKQDAKKWVRTQGAPERRNGRTVRIVGAVQDLTARKMAERDRNRLFNVLEQSLNEIYVFDTETLRFEYVNAAARRNLGYAAAELRTMTPLDITPTLDADAFAVLVGPLRRREKERVVFETIHRRVDGTRYPVKVHLQLAFQANHTAFLALILDTTDDKRVAKEKAELEDMVRQAQKMEAVGRLAGGVAHDFNNLLTVIQGYGEILDRQLSAGDPGRAHLDEMLEAAGRAARLTRQLLAFSRKQVIQPEILDLGTLVTDAVQLLRTVIGEHIHVVTRLAPSLHRVLADPGHIDQVVMNLALNARDAMPRGGTLTFGVRDAILDVEFARNHPGARAGCYVLIAVTDTGCGMTPETASMVFEPFFTTKDADKGTGLGLATVFGIVKQNDGYIGVESELNCGAAFNVYLPCAEEEEAASASIEPPLLAATSAPTETIVVAEDEAAVRELMSRVLNERGYTVIGGTSPDEALAAVRAHVGRIDLLLTDVVMPEETGPELAARVRDLSPDIRVLYVSGYPTEIIDRHGVLAPSVAFLQKPFKPDGLLRKVRETLDAPRET